MRADRIKANGVHYTPPRLAEFLATVTAEALGAVKGTIEILDPACGDGVLLRAFVQSLPARSRARIVLHGYETDPDALHSAQQLLAETGVLRVNLVQQDFLSVQGVDTRLRGRQLSLLDQTQEAPPARFDAVIANPPYVRTQVLGTAKAQELAQRFGLTGRVDLYQAFAKAMANVLKPGGILGLLTSNRFLTVKSGAALRHLLRTEFELVAIYDLGDTKLFSAAVLPVIVVARRQRHEQPGKCLFERVYEHRSNTADTTSPRKYPKILDAFRDREANGVVAAEAGLFRIERGVLLTTESDEVWSLSTPDYQQWLQTVQANQQHRFESVAHIRVGIKTTADQVFIRDDWESLPAALQPENKLLRPLITHLNAGKWVAVPSSKRHKVLYPHTIQSGRRVPVDLKAYPRARAYLESHRERLTRRKYVIEAGRQWYEIWVPHSPTDWAKPKIVFPDIAEEPRFFLDSSGAVANGDCYWITLRAGCDPDWLHVILAIANSSFITKYYDLAFHNKLYAGRRRFMTQYVRMFPLPDLSKPVSRKIVAIASRLVSRQDFEPDLEARLDSLVWESFGLSGGSQAARQL
ncbi:MAG: N-6 DNA methylase [Thermoguttaceae bacterium]